MNIMLVSVRERTREIGIRKAIGAKQPGHPRSSSSSRPSSLSLLGGLIGIVVGLVVVRRSSARSPAGASRSTRSTLVVALLFSLAVGVVFGVWPARQAARLDPIAALRYE